MIHKIAIVSLMVLTPLAFAQKVDIKDVDSQGQESTTIEIKKGKPGQPMPGQVTWELAEGSIELTGETAATTKEAKAEWKKECLSWKKEFREENKDNKVIAIGCGVPTCTGDAGSKVCTSKTTYKVKTKITN